MGRPENTFVFTYSKIADLTGKTTNAVTQAVNRKDFDPNDLHSLVSYVIKHARPEIKKRFAKAILA